MTRWPHFKIFAGALATTLLLLSVPHHASAQDDPPGRVARLHSVEGSVSVQPAGSDDWGTAEPNRPITTGDKLWSDQNSRVELGLGSAYIRLGANTAFTFLNLTDQIAQISVNEGTLDVHLRSLGDQETFEIDTPNLAFSLLRSGDYRVGVNENGDTTIVTVRSGTGEVTGGGQAFTMSPNTTGTFVGTDQLTPDIGTAVPPDDFDAWCLDLNGREDRAPRFVSPDMVGAEDLDANGNWQNVPDYGNVWVPNGVVAGWQPYQYGRWVWVSPWGWTWVDDAPWGFAPFHYGRWVFVNGYWGWTPGPAFVVGAPRPVYSPALVAWVGGPGAGLAIGVGGVGVAWFPLGPREVYVPPYAVSRTYVTNINVTNTIVDRTTVINVYNNVTVNHVTNITYVNRSYVTATSQNSFTSGQAINRNVIKVDPSVIARAQVGTAVGAGVAPQARSEFAGRVATNVPHPAAAVASRQIVAKTAPPPPPPSFASQQKAIAANGGKPLAPAQMNAIRPASTSAAAKTQVRIAPPAKPAPATSTSGNRGNAPAANQPSSNRPASSTPPANSGNRADRPPSAQPKTTNPPPATNSGSRPPSQPNTTKPPVVTNDNMKPAPKPAATQPTENKPQPAENKPPSVFDGNSKAVATRSCQAARGSAEEQHCGQAAEENRQETTEGGQARQGQGQELVEAC